MLHAKLRDYINFVIFLYLISQLKCKSKKTRNIYLYKKDIFLGVVWEIILCWNILSIRCWVQKPMPSGNRDLSSL